MPAINAADKLTAVVRNQMQNINAHIRAEFSALRPGIISKANNNLGSRLNWQNQVRQFLNYAPNTDVYAASEMLYLPSKLSSSISIVVVFHGVGDEYQGAIACFAIANDGRDNLSPLSEEAFQFDFKDSLEQTQKRFEQWLQKALAKGLRMWKERL